MENINVNQEVVETVKEVSKSMDWKEVGLLGLAFVGGGALTYKGIKFVVNKGKAIFKKDEAKKIHEIKSDEEIDVTENTEED